MNFEKLNGKPEFKYKALPDDPRHFEPLKMDNKKAHDPQYWYYAGMQFKNQPETYKAKFDPRFVLVAEAAYNDKRAGDDWQTIHKNLKRILVRT